LSELRWIHFVMEKLRKKKRAEEVRGRRLISMEGRVGRLVARVRGQRQWLAARAGPVTDAPPKADLRIGRIRCLNFFTKHQLTRR